ncbi:MAG: amidohydrolase family protein, partial [Bacteroidota bacterium]
LADKRPPNGLKAVYEDFDGAYPKLSEEGLAALGKVASEKATWLAVHTESNAHLREALAAGATIIEYGSHEAMDSLTIASLASSNALFLPMLGRAKGNPDRLSILQENVSKVYQAGGQLGVGSDAQDQLSFGNSLHEEMSLLVEAGVPALEVIKAATQVASRYLKADDIMGGLQVGKLANVLVIKGKPYEQIQDSYKLQWMLQEGKWIIENQELIDP